MLTREQHFITRRYKCRSDKECTWDTTVGTNRCFHSSRNGQNTVSHISCVRYSNILHRGARRERSSYGHWQQGIKWDKGTSAASYTDKTCQEITIGIRSSYPQKGEIMNGIPSVSHVQPPRNKSTCNRIPHWDTCQNKNETVSQS